MTETTRLYIVPLTLKEANDFVAVHHRHHKPVVGHRFSIGTMDEANQLRGVLIAGRPVARMTDWHTTLEVLRVATDGCRNACSVLYGAAKRIARHMGFERILTFTLETELGTSLKAAGWIQTGQTGGGEWGRPSRAREIVAPITPKRRWELILNPSRSKKVIK